MSHGCYSFQDWFWWRRAPLFIGNSKMTWSSRLYSYPLCVCRMHWLRVSAALAESSASTHTLLVFYAFAASAAEQAAKREWQRALKIGKIWVGANSALILDKAMRQICSYCESVKTVLNYLFSVFVLAWIQIHSTQNTINHKIMHI